MTTELDHERELREIARALVADAPDVPHSMLDVRSSNLKRAAGRRPALIAAAALVMIGGGGLLGAQLAIRDRSSTDPNDSAADSAVAAAAQVTTGPPTTAGLARPDVRFVLPGDSLASIADELCTTPAQIAAYNDWDDGVDHPLFPQDIIEIPPGSCGPVAPTTAVPGAVGPLVPTEQEYVVQTGDYLAGIAESFGVSIEDLAEYNGWPEGANAPLLPGQVILIPPTAAMPASTASLPATAFVLGWPIAVVRRRRRA